MVRFVAWAIPAIGFVGTVRGIGEVAAAGAQGGRRRRLRRRRGPRHFVQFDARSRCRSSILVMFVLHQIQLRQERPVLDIEEYVDRTSCGRCSSADRRHDHAATLALELNDAGSACSHALTSTAMPALVGDRSAGFALLDGRPCDVGETAATAHGRRRSTRTTASGASSASSRCRGRRAARDAGGPRARAPVDVLLAAQPHARYAAAASRCPPGYPASSSDSCWAWRTSAACTCRARRPRLAALLGTSSGSAVLHLDLAAAPGGRDAARAGVDDRVAASALRAAAVARLWLSQQALVEPRRGRVRAAHAVRSVARGAQRAAPVRLLPGWVAALAAPARPSRDRALGDNTHRDDARVRASCTAAVDGLATRRAAARAGGASRRRARCNCA